MAQRLKKETNANMATHRAPANKSPTSTPRPALTRSADACWAKYGSISAESDLPFLGSAPGATLSSATVRIVLTAIVRYSSAAVYIALVNTADGSAFWGLLGLAPVEPNSGKREQRWSIPSSSRQNI